MGARRATERHGVELFDDGADIGARVAAFVSAGLAAGGAIIVIARARNLDAIRAHLPPTELETAIAEERAYLLDADETLATLLVDGGIDTGRIDAERFRQHVETLLSRLGERGLSLYAYGEMVDVLWSAGNADAMLELERLWSVALESHPFDLLCGYRIAGFDRHHDAFDTVLAAHDHVHSSAGTGHTVAQLQQRARALQSEVERRERVEHLMSHLIEISNELAVAHAREDIVRTIIDRGGQPLPTSAIAVWTLGADGESLELLDTTPAERAVAATYRRMPLAGDTPIATAVRTGESFFLGSLDEYAARFPASRERIEAIRSSAHQAFAIVPYQLGTVRLAICFTYAQPRTFDDAERNYQTLLARHCTGALARIQLFEQARADREAALRSAAAEKQARSDVELLYEMIATFNRLDDIDAVYELALAQVKRGSSSDRAAILLFDADHKMRFRAWTGLSETYRTAVDGHSPWQPAHSFPAPIIVDDTETDPAWAAYRDVFRAEGIRALAFVPIVHRRKLIGKFMLYRNAPRPFAPRDLQLTATVAVHVAQAVERKQQERELARAYKEERAAHLHAEEAARAREEILSVVSHDLRNPIGTIMMGASTLLNVNVHQDAAQRVRTTGERIHRQAERMARMIEDLVDFAGIQHGRLALERGRHSPHDILSTTREIFGPIASERGLRLETEAVLNLPPVECDSNRAVQILSNLVSNALKVTPKGGHIAIGASLMRHPDGSSGRRLSPVPLDAFGRPARGPSNDGTSSGSTRATSGARATSSDSARDTSGGSFARVDGTNRPDLLGGELVFFVRDTGPGIDPEDLPNLFERHWRGKQTSYRGTGLGLSIARGIVDAHGGRIWVESRPGGGSTFYFSLTPSN